jgi:pyridoxal phosphate enzyme (YggS family)
MATGVTKEARAQQIAANLARVRERIAAACRRAGRDSGQVELVCVTKYAELDEIEALIAAGAVHLGESRVQQLVERANSIASRNLSPVWHMIGHLQRNKVRQLLPHSRVLHSLDSIRLAEELEAQASKLDVTVEAYVEVNVAGEVSKSGIGVGEAAALADAVGRMPHIRLRGLMTMAPLSEDPERSRPHFASLRELLCRYRKQGVVGEKCEGLSMGMSQDYAIAVEEGATVVRVGSALFEPDAGG